MYIVKDKTLGDCVFAIGFTRKYFKTITVSAEREWEKPAISESGTIGGSTFACAYLRGFESYFYKKEVETTEDDYDRYEDHINILRGEIK